MKVLGIGEIVLDKIYLINEFLKEGSKIEPLRIDYSFGGPVGSALILLSRLGIHCDLVGTIGRDKFGASIRKKIRKERINLIPVEQHSTKNNIILVNQKDVTRTIIHDKTSHEPIQHLPKEIIQNADVIVMDRHEPLAFEEVLRLKRKETPIILDPSTEISEKTMRMFKSIDYIILPIEAFNKFGIKGTIENKLHQVFLVYQKPIIATAGSVGSIVYTGRQITIIPSFKINPIDVLGAGDVFRGGFVFGLLNKWPIEKIVEFSNLVAALQCTRIGNGTAIPSSVDIIRFQNNAIKNPVTISDFNQYSNI